jgi:hypothetical protein
MRAVRIELVADLSVPAPTQSVSALNSCSPRKTVRAVCELPNEILWAENCPIFLPHAVGDAISSLIHCAASTSSQAIDPVGWIRCLHYQQRQSVTSCTCHGFALFRIGSLGSLNGFAYEGHSGF